MSDPFEQAVREAARGLGSAGEQPTYHDAFVRGSQRRVRKRAVMAVSGALMLIAAFGVTSGRFGSPTVEVDDIAIGADAVTAVPESAGTPTATPTTQSSESRADAAANATTVSPAEADDATGSAGDEPDDQDADAAPDDVAPPTPTPETATAVPLPDASQDDAPEAETSVAPTPAPTSPAAAPTTAPTAVAAAPTVAPTPTVQPSATPNPAASFAAPSPTPTSPAAAPSTIDDSSEPDDGDASAVVVADPTPAPTATAAPTQVPTSVPTAVPTATATPAPTAVPPPTPTPTPTTPPTASLSPGQLPPSVDAIMSNLPAVDSGKCDTTGDSVPDAACELFFPYPCSDTSQALPYYVAFDTDADGLIDTCLPNGLASCDTIGDLIGDTACLIEPDLPTG